MGFPLKEKKKILVNGNGWETNLYSVGKLDHRPVGFEMPCLPRVDSTAEFHTSNENEEVEYFFASDASAIIEHTNRVIFLEVKQLFFFLLQRVPEERN
jgi:glucosamine 6-phosphate synthetase-like amidotransferase/phosphosugar isomerase protein